MANRPTPENLPPVGSVVRLYFHGTKILTRGRYVVHGYTRSHKSVRLVRVDDREQTSFTAQLNRVVWEGKDSSDG